MKKQKVKFSRDTLQKQGVSSGENQPVIAYRKVLTKQWERSKVHAVLECGYADQVNLRDEKAFYLC